MKRIFYSLASWWFANMTPVHTPATKLSEREELRKRRLLSIMLLSALISTMGYLFSEKISSFSEVIPFLICAVFITAALWLNRQGYLKLASILLYFGPQLTAFIGARTFSLSDPLILLWTCFLMTILLTYIGLFVPPWMIILSAVIENIMMFWYLLVLNHTQITHSLSPSQLEHALLYLCILIYSSALIGSCYAFITKRAVIQADRAAELEQAHAGLEQAYTTIQKQALTDGLTGLPNHRALMEHLQKELERARRYERPFSLVFFDADHFKHINDTYGHAAGDTVLHQLGERAGSVLRGGDILGRFGGEEFVALLSDADGSKASIAAERIRAAVATGLMALSEVEEGIAMTVSIGVATYPSDGTQSQELLSQADGAMYVAKRLGRNQVRTAEEARNMSADEELMTMLLQEGQLEAAAREDTTPELLRETYTLRAINSLMALLDRRNEGLSAHAHAVSNLATMIAQAMELEHKDVDRIGMAGLLHDIGKVAIPDLLLQKADHLSNRERAILEEHPVLGAQILEASPFLHDLRPAVGHHHEHWDGHGYPDQLRGEEIPLAARIIAVAEAYDAMLRDRPYQAGRSKEEAMKELQRCTGTQFDPAVVQALSGLLVQGPAQLPSTQLVG